MDLEVDPVINAAKARIPVAKPWLSEYECWWVNESLKRGYCSTHERVADLERRISADHGKAYGVATNSGYTALHLALHAAGVGPGSEVILPTLTMVACANAVLACGAKPVFVDSLPGTGNADPLAFERAVTPATKAAMIVHLYGLPAKIPRLPADVELVEDCCEAHFASFPSGRPVGSAGRFAVFSFYANKIIAAGEGGMVCCNSLEDATRLTGLRAHAFTPGSHFHHQEQAFGYRMTEMAGALGFAQHVRKRPILQERDRVGKLYQELLKDCPNLDAPPHLPGSVWWVYPIVLAGDRRGDKSKLRQALADEGVETRSYFKPLHQQPHLMQYAPDPLAFPVADDLAARGLYLPLFPEMQNDEVELVCKVVRSVLA